MRLVPLAVAAAAGLALTGAAQADIITYEFMMDGLQEVPPVATPGWGECTVQLDTLSGAVTVNGTFNNLIGNVTAAHIHGAAAPGVNAGVIVGLTPVGGTSGTISGNGVLTAQQIQDMINGLTYVNVHSVFRPGGEIRGQVVPAPASLGLIGLGGLLAARRRR